MANVFDRQTTATATNNLPSGREHAARKEGRKVVYPHGPTPLTETNYWADYIQVYGGDRGGSNNNSFVAVIGTLPAAILQLAIIAELKRTWFRRLCFASLFICMLCSKESLSAHLGRHPVRRANEGLSLAERGGDLRRDAKVGQLHLALQRRKEGRMTSISISAAESDPTRRGLSPCRRGVCWPP